MSDLSTYQHKALYPKHNMWQAEIESKTFENGVLKIGVQYTNGTQKFSESIDLTGGDMKTLSIKIQSKLDTLNASEATNTAIMLGNFSAPVPDQAEVDKQIYFSDLQTLQKMQSLIDSGIKDAQDKDFTDLQLKIKAEFKPEYV